MVKEQCGYTGGRCCEPQNDCAEGNVCVDTVCQLGTPCRSIEDTEKLCPPGQLCAIPLWGQHNGVCKAFNTFKKETDQCTQDLAAQQCPPGDWCQYFRDSGGSSCFAPS
jgi:hypothetical protein